MIGNLRTRVKIYQAVFAPDNRGGQSKTFTLWGSPYADVRATAATARGSGLHQAQSRYKAVIRYRHGFPKEARLIWKDRHFRVVAADDPDGRHERLHLICDEILDPAS